MSTIFGRSDFDGIVSSDTLDWPTSVEAFTVKGLMPVTNSAKSYPHTNELPTNEDSSSA